MIPSSDQMATARMAVLKYAQAETKREGIRSELDTRISGIGGFTLGKGRLYGLESEASFATRIAQTEPVQALLQKAFMEKIIKEEALSRFSQMLQETLYGTLSDAIPDGPDRERKAEGIAKAVVRQLTDSIQTERYHLFARAATDALAYQTGIIEVVFSGTARAVIEMAGEKGIATSDELEARRAVSDKYLSDILLLNAQKALVCKQTADDNLNALTKNILERIHSRDERRSSKTSRDIAKEVITEATSRPAASFLPKTLKHPLNALWAEMGKASATPVFFAELRARVISGLALAVHHHKHYDPAESMRKAEHIFSYLTEGLDEEAVRHYVEAYRSCLPLQASQLASLESAQNDVRYIGPRFKAMADESALAGHYTHLLDQERVKLDAKTPTIYGQLRSEADTKGIGTGRVNADSFIRGLASNEELMLQFYKKALFKSANPSLSDDEKLTSYRDQLAECLGERLDALTGRISKEVWMDQAAKKIASELDRLYPSKLLEIDRSRAAFGLHQSPAVMDEALFKFTEYETRALARIGFEKDLMSWCTRIREKVDLRPAAPDIHQIEFAFNPDVATKMATDFFTSAPQSATLADFQIALSSALVNILSGTAGMDEHLHSSHEARERLRNFTASIIERFSTLVDMESIRESIQLRRTVLGLSGETVDTTASQYIAYRQTGA